MTSGKNITIDLKNNLIVPDNPIIPFIKGDGIGEEIFEVMRNIVDEAVKKAYGNKRKIIWKEYFAGEKALEKYGNPLPDETVKAFKEYIVGIKGPIDTPESYPKNINIAFRQKLNLYTSIRPIIWYGQGSPVRSPELVDYIVFRENTDDIYVGIEFEENDNQTVRVVNFFRNKLNISKIDLPADSSVALKPTSKSKSKRHIRKAFQQALKLNRKHITIVHRGNILKKTENQFVKWAYEVAKEPQFINYIITEQDLIKNFDGNFEKAKEEGYKIVLKDRIITKVLSHLVSRVEEYDVILAQNLNGDYFTHTASGLIGGSAFVPVANVGDTKAVFETLHGTARNLKGKNIANPTGMILAGVMMLEYINWKEASNLIIKALKQTFADWIGTYDVIREWATAAIPGKKVSTDEFGIEIIKRL